MIMVRIIVRVSVGFLNYLDAVILFRDCLSVLHRTQHYTMLTVICEP